MVVGIIALAWPSVTVLALVIVFAVYAFIAAGLQAARAFSSRKAGPVRRQQLRSQTPTAEMRIGFLSCIVSTDINYQH